jgi:hypothetical protein
VRSPPNLQAGGPITEEYYSTYQQRPSESGDRPPLQRPEDNPCPKDTYFLYGSTALYGPGPPHFVEVSWSHTFETHHSR